MESTSLFHGLSGLSPEDQILVSRWGRGPAVSAPHRTVHEAFEAIVDSQPSTIAARHAGKTMTYGDLDTAANRLANHLIELGLGSKQRVCLVVQRSFEMLVAIFAVLKAGCQYVPVDGGVSTDQTLRHIFKDTGSRFILCLPKYEDKVRRLAEKEAVVLSLTTDAAAFCPKSRPLVPVSATDGVYAIYTSGKHALQNSVYQN